MPPASVEILLIPTDKACVPVSGTEIRQQTQVDGFISPAHLPKAAEAVPHTPWWPCNTRCGEEWGVEKRRPGRVGAVCFSTPVTCLHNSDAPQLALWGQEVKRLPEQWLAHIMGGSSISWSICVIVKTASIKVTADLAQPTPWIIYCSGSKPWVSKRSWRSLPTEAFTTAVQAISGSCSPRKSEDPKLRTTDLLHKNSHPNAHTVFTAQDDSSYNYLGHSSRHLML